MLAVNKVQTDMTRILLVAGADITLKDLDGDDVFAYAKPRQNQTIDIHLAKAKEILATQQ